MLRLLLLVAAQCYTGDIFSVNGYLYTSVTDPTTNRCIVCELAEYADFSGRSEDSVALRALWTAVTRNNIACARAFLESGLTSATVVDRESWSPLDVAREPEIVDLLLRHGADLEVKTRVPFGRTPLIFAISYGRATVDVLLAAGAALCTFPVSAFDVIEQIHMNQQLESLGKRVKDYPCEPGFYLKEGANCRGLTICEEGHYCPGHRQRTNTRHECPAGTYGPHSGGATVLQCRLCPPARPLSSPRSTDRSDCHSEDPASAQYIKSPLSSETAADAGPRQPGATPHYLHSFSSA